MLSKAILGGAFLGIVLFVTPSFADGCSDTNAQLDTALHNGDQIAQEFIRVSRLKPLPHTDAALCAAANNGLRELTVRAPLDRQCFANDTEHARAEAFLGALLGYFHQRSDQFHCGG
jgi:hypothetical protein